ncbi:MAG: LPP20 family lipoprotein [Methylobacter sp.]|uniref:LPP20 family lipoprotein n=1 Tax=Candidatus Methylobacter titanis TaxID=3053457 RepID=A0AA43Q3W9_9GAMM|nr:LPP20 family lipoprotein [Candidatus Methylobacter titanis]MDI1293679.1 LPP20 family lipoprotein [Candidatus Methylobacter titanis]
MKIKYLKPAFAAPIVDRIAAYTPSLAIAAFVPDKRTAYTPSLVITGLVISLLMTACTTAKTPPAPSLAFLPNKTINATGYGTVEKSDKYSHSQIKLMAMRASKMDAYRSLAEQLNGIQLRGQTSIENMQVSHDSYQVYLNAYVRGARVKRTSVIGSDAYAGDDTFETVVELDLTPRFYECINGSSELMNQCLQQNPETSAPNAGHTVPTTVSSISSGCNAIDCYNYPSTKGFNRQ